MALFGHPTRTDECLLSGVKQTFVSASGMSEKCHPGNIRRKEYGVTDSFKGQSRRGLTLHPEIDGGNLVASLDNGVGEAQLAVEFERPRLNRYSPRGRPRLARLVDDRTLAPSLVSQSARTRPVGPAPTIRTSLRAISSSLQAAGPEPDQVHPGAYASEADDARLIAVTAEMADGQIGEMDLVDNSKPRIRLR